MTGHPNVSSKIAGFRMIHRLKERVSSSSRISPAVRSQMMRSIRKTNTGPERTVRRLIRELGYRYRLNARDLPGSPDIIFRAKRIAIFVHGCFWHQHEKCRLAKLPTARPEYWIPKLQRNKQRDQHALSALVALGWTVLVVWECEQQHEQRLKRKLAKFLRCGLD
jgi:DNA mismatch endonuclease (patch repair protein)